LPKKLLMVVLSPLVELPGSALNEHCYHTTPILVLEGLRIVGDIKFDIFSSEIVLKVDPLLEAYISHRLFVLSID